MIILKNGSEYLEKDKESTSYSKKKFGDETFGSFVKAYLTRVQILKSFQRRTFQKVSEVIWMNLNLNHFNTM